MSSQDQEHRITYKAGITRTPSDFLCQDGELAECINLTTDHEELKLMVPPKEYISGALDPIGEEMAMPKILHIHKFNDVDAYIGYIENGGDPILIYGRKEGNYFRHVGYLGQGYPRYNLRYQEGIKFATIGKILIVNQSDGLYYFMWQKDGDSYFYEPYGKNFPAPKIEFKLSGRNSEDINQTIKAAGIYYDDPTDRFDIRLGEQQVWNDTVIGLYTELRKKVWQKKKFHGSFCVRVALELIGGGYYLISNPIFMLNQFSAYCVARINGSAQSQQPMKMHLHGQSLMYKFGSENDYTHWADIVKNVVLFVTQEANLFDTTVDAVCDLARTIPDTSYTPIAYFMSDNVVGRDNTNVRSAPDSEGELYRVLPSISDSDLEEKIKSGIYYKLCEIGLQGDGQWHNAGDHFDTHTLENITTYPRIEEDDYYSHNQLMADLLFSYNSRLNLANVSRGIFEGFGSFMPFVTPLNGSANPDSSNYEFIVTVSTDNGDIVVSHTEQTNQRQGIYFYYPDARAKHVVIKKNGTQILNTDLMEHPTLNGAYYFAGVTPTMTEPSSASGDIPTVSATKFERLPNYIITSDVNNPFAFGKRGYNKVGTGHILAISTTTMALSQDQFGQRPLIVFSESGVWGMAVDKTGLFEAIDPFTRDVLINPHNVIQTDGAVYFVSKRGLMVVTDKGVSCVSEQMNGVAFDYTGFNLTTRTEWDMIIPSRSGVESSFQDFVCGEKCMIAYDYIDSRLIMINPDFDFHYIMNLTDGTISRCSWYPGATNVVNNYPDYLIQEGNIIYSLYEKDREDEYQNRHMAFLLTRPMKLGGPVGKVSLRQLMNVGMWDEAQSTVKVTVYISDDLRRWYKDSSRFGTAAKYYRLAIFLRMLPSERLSGTIITTQDRRTNNLR